MSSIWTVTRSCTRIGTVYVLKTTDATNAVLCYLIGSTAKVGKESDSLNHSPFIENERRKLLAWQSPWVLWKILHIYLALLAHKSGNWNSQPENKPILHIHNIQTTFSSAMACVRRHSWEAILTKLTCKSLLLLRLVTALAQQTLSPISTPGLMVLHTPACSSSVISHKPPHFPPAFPPTNSAQRPQWH